MAAPTSSRRAEPVLRALLVAAALALVGCAGTAPPVAPTAVRQPVTVAVVRDGPNWSAEYRLPRAAPAWAFIRSANAEATGQSWRAASWTVETPGVRLERIGRYDALVADSGDVPEVVRIRFTPFTDEVRSDYVPALALSDGTVALFDDHFLVFSAPSRDSVERLPADLNGQPIDDSGTRVTFRDSAGPLLHMGRRAREVTTQNSNSYILFGARDPIVTDSMAAVIDPALPTWLADSLRELTPAILSRYAAELGPAPGGPPTLLASWAGAMPGRASMNGGVVPGTMIMRFDGEGIVERNSEMLNLARWFIAHEGSHFWLGQAVRYGRSSDAWMLEGGADLLAIRTVQALDPSYDWKGEINRALHECAGLIENRGVASAEDRGEHRAYYACGAIFALVAEARSGRPYSAFVRGLVDSNRNDGVLTRDEWLDALDGVARDPGIRMEIEVLLDRGATQPKSALTSLLRRAGIAHVVGEDGTPHLQ